jgi:hypothetical protein
VPIPLLIKPLRPTVVALTTALLVVAGCDGAPVAPEAEWPGAGHDVRTDTYVPRVGITRGPVPLHLYGLQGTAMIQIVGAVGASVNGNMSIDIGDNRTEYLVRDGELRREGDGYRWILNGLAIETRQGSAIHRTFSSELTLRSGETVADDDIWIIDDLVCFYDQGELICL